MHHAETLAKIFDKAGKRNAEMKDLFVDDTE